MSLDGRQQWLHSYIVPLPFLPSGGVLVGELGGLGGLG